ncbi:hypothetical protein LAZ67_20000138 [Cordylochernes scorpioides]|uniref:Sulfotransferase domain-containing protein n=1 Tax=Cordylochernes scorpioides TaxID=51811 RepID=A0ABY6LIZ8_9ARAC|nr:hypothetical protein LAZ67_20000138 [Cordylochernes scorpioides]
MSTSPKYLNVDGITVCGAFSEDAVRSAINYKPRDDDIFVVTFPKSGTTWMQNIVFHILNKGKPLDSVHEFWARTPYLELCGADAIEKMPRPGAIKIHLPFNKAPYSSSAKYIYVARNPKDTCVSFYHHTRKLKVYEFDGLFDEFFELFFNGRCDYDDYFDHILSWYEHRNDPNVLFLTYEGLKTDTRNSILKVAKFLGEEYENMIIDDPEILENVLKYSSIEEMKKVEKEQPKEAPPIDVLPSGLKHLRNYVKERGLSNISNFDLVRKGIVGDWKNHFNEEQAKKLDERTREKLAGTDLLKFWQKLGILE